MKAPSTIKTHADSTRQAPPPYSDLSAVVENCVNSESLPQLLDSRCVFHIAPKTAIGRQVHDANGTLVLSVLRQPVSDKDWWTRNVFLNSTGRPVMEMKSTAQDGKDAQVFNKTWTIYEGGRVVGMLRYFFDKSELVGYRISGEEMFRTAADGPYSWTVRKDGKHLAVIAKGDNLYTTSLAINNDDEEFEVKALLLCSAIYYDSVCLKGSTTSTTTPVTLQTTPPSTRTTVITRPYRQKITCIMCLRDTMKMITILLLVLVPVVFLFVIFK